MAKTIDIPGSAAPNNLRLPESAKAVVVESDMYNICNRVRDISPNLYIVLLTDNTKYSYAIMENCADGVDRLVYKVRTLDGRVLERLRYLMSVPLDVRVKELEKEEHRLKADAKEAELEELYERVGDPMRHQLIKDGFADRRSFYRKTSYNRRSV